jgi:hypothetical protein
MKKPARKTAAREVEVRHILARLQGCLKGKPGDKPFSDWWAEHKREERMLEERRDHRLMSLIKPCKGRNRKQNGGP